MVNAKSIVHSLVATRQLVTINNNNFDAFSMAPGFPIAQVAVQAEKLPTHSWEYGTAAQALLELYNPDLSVFGKSPFPYQPGSEEVKALTYAEGTIKIGEKEGRLFESDGSAADPASVGVSAVMLGKKDKKYASAATNTLNFLLNTVPRHENGAISHRVKAAVLWADFMYMAPPFIAYYGADSGNATILHESVKQCGYYRDVLKSNKGVWKHIIGENSEDLGLWATGNGWATAGMARVLATVMKAPVAEDADWKDGAVENLTTWIMEIIDGAMDMPMDGGLLRNYLDDTNSKGHGFGEISGSSLIAATIFRMAVLQPDACGQKYIDWANDIRVKLGAKDANGDPHVTKGGIVTPAVNPLAWKDTKPFTTGSPEGQSFVVLMYSAWRDCVSAGKCGSQVPANPKIDTLAQAASPFGVAMKRRMHRRRAHSGAYLLDRKAL